MAPFLWRGEKRDTFQVQLNEELLKNILKDSLKKYNILCELLLDRLGILKKSRTWWQLPLFPKPGNSRGFPNSFSKCC